MTDLFDDIRDAHAGVRPEVLVTPLTQSLLLSEELGCEVWLKCDHLQPTGSFKIRGATNKIRKLGAGAQATGVVTSSTGNHGQALALAGARAGVPVTVVAAAAAAPGKLAAIRALGAELITVEASSLEAEAEARVLAARRGVPYISPYNDPDVVAGQGTLGMELAEQLPDLDAVFIATGGGGLIAGTGTALKALAPAAKVVGCWPEASPGLALWIEAGREVPFENHETLSDGTAGGLEAGTITFPIARRVVDACLRVSEDEIRRAMRRIAETDQWMLEGSAAVPLAALAANRDAWRGRKVVLVLCGRNIGLDRFVAAVA